MRLLLAVLIALMPLSLHAAAVEIYRQGLLAAAEQVRTLASGGELSECGGRAAALKPAAYTPISSATCVTSSRN